MSAPSESGTGLCWTYDIWGNRKGQKALNSGSCSTPTVTINNLNRIADTGYVYDNSGNLINESGVTRTFDAENRLTYTNSTLGTATYVYDAFGRRASKTVGSDKTDYIHDIYGNVVAEWLTNPSWPNGVWSVGYVYANGELVAQYKDATTYFIHKDHLGSTRAVTYNGTYAATDFQPFGETSIGSSGVVMANPGFENGTSGWAVGYWGTTATVTSAQAYTGTYSMAHSGSVTGGTYRDVGALVPGRSYNISVWVKADAGTTAQMQLWLHDTTGANQILSTAFFPGTGWQQVTLSYTATSTAAVRIHLHYLAGSGTIYYDDARIEQVNSGISTTRLFTGHERDAESALDHTWFRKYSSAQARWLSPDPLGGDISNPQSLNRYSYVLNRATNLVDPLGLTGEDPTIPVTGGGDINWGCTLNGIPFGCGGSLDRLVSSGAAAVCPGSCTGNFSDGRPVRFVATVSGGRFFAYSGVGALFYSRNAAMAAAALANAAATNATRDKTKIVQEYWSYMYNFGGLYTHGAPTAGEPCTGTGVELRCRTFIPYDLPGNAFGLSHSHPDDQELSDTDERTLTSFGRPVWGAVAPVGIPGQVLIFNPITSTICVLQGPTNSITPNRCK